MTQFVGREWEKTVNVKYSAKVAEDVVVVGMVSGGSVGTTQPYIEINGKEVISSDESAMRVVSILGIRDVSDLIDEIIPAIDITHPF